MQNLYKLSRIFCVLASVSVAATVLWLTARQANAEDAQPEAVISAAPPAAAEASNMAASVLKPKPAHNSYKPYFVEFRARSAATYGHMYVIYGKVNGRGEIITSDIAGLHPAGDTNNCVNCSVIPWTIGHLLFVPSETGASDGDLEEKYVSARYRVMVDADTFKKVSAYIGKLKADTPMWNALLRNCVSFGNNIAENLGLKTPSFVWLEPKDYVEHLRELNGGKPQGALRFATSSLVKTSVSAPPDLLPSRTLSVPRKPKKQPAANSPPSQAIGVASGATH